MTGMGLFCQASCFWVFAPVSLFGAERPFFIPSHASGFRERAEGVKGTETLE